MPYPTKQIRELIGENEVEAAIRILCECLSDSEEHDLYDLSLLQKSRFNDFRRRDISKLAEEKELIEIRAAVLNLTRELDKRAEAPKSSGQSVFELDPRPPAQGPPPPPPSPAPPPISQPAVTYVGQCFFQNDPITYYITSNNQIVAIQPFTQSAMPVASRVPSQNAAVAWIYLFPNGFFYNIDHAGAIWGVNAFGMPMQMGYVQYF